MLQTLLTLSLFVFSASARALDEELALGVPLLPRAACAQDNCYRAYLHSTAIASPFCATYIQSTTTKTITPSVTVSGGVTTSSTISTGTVPAQTTNAQLLSRCNLDTVPAGGVATPVSLRLSSACTCISVTPATVTVTTLAPATVSSFLCCPTSYLLPFPTTTILPPPPPDCSNLPTISNQYTAPNSKVFTINCAMTGYVTHATEIADGQDLSNFKDVVDKCSSISFCYATIYANGVYTFLQYSSSPSDGVGYVFPYNAAVLVG